MPLMMRRRMSMHGLLTVIIVLRHTPHSKQSEEQGINILAAALSKSSITNIRKAINISTKASGCNPSENELSQFILKSSVTV
jgi:putative exporter of polyketide antibiotics